MTNATISRRADVVSRVEGDETLVLDLRTQTAHCLSGDLARVWGATETSVAGLAAALSLSVEAVEAAAASLAELGLVQVGASGMSRRMLVRGAAVGGAVVAAGAISIPLPAAARANSTNLNLSVQCITDNSNAAKGSAQLTIGYGSSGPLTANANYTVTVKYRDSATTTTTDTGITAKASSDGKSFVSATRTTTPAPSAGHPGYATVAAGQISYVTLKNAFAGDVTITLVNQADSTDTRSQTFANAITQNC